MWRFRLARILDRYFIKTIEYFLRPYRASYKHWIGRDSSYQKASWVTTNVKSLKLACLISICFSKADFFFCKKIQNIVTDRRILQKEKCTTASHSYLYFFYIIQLVDISIKTKKVDIFCTMTGQVKCQVWFVTAEMAKIKAHLDKQNGHTQVFNSFYLVFNFV